MKQIRKIVYPGIETGKKKKQLSRGILQKGVLRNFTKLTGKHLCQSFFFNKVPALRPATLLKRRIWHRCFPVNFVKFLRTPFFIEHLWTTVSEDRFFMPWLKQENARTGITKIAGERLFTHALKLSGNIAYA